jgi:hypothetical protein
MSAPRGAPAERASAPRGAPAEQPSAPAEDGRLGYPILIIDDHELFSTSPRMALRGQGFAARQLPIDGLAELRERVGQYRPGLAVLDLDLGQDAHGRWVNGVELVDALRAAGWQVLVVSGSVDTAGVAAAIAAGAVCWPSWRCRRIWRRSRWSGKAHNGRQWA